MHITLVLRQTIDFFSLFFFFFFFQISYLTFDFLHKRITAVAPLSRTLQHEELEEFCLGFHKYVLSVPKWLVMVWSEMVDRVRTAQRVRAIFFLLKILARLAVQLNSWISKIHNLFLFHLEKYEKKTKLGLLPNAVIFKLQAWLFSSTFELERSINHLFFSLRKIEKKFKLHFKNNLLQNKRFSALLET